MKYENIAIMKNIIMKLFFYLVFIIITIYVLIELISVSNFSYKYVKLIKYGNTLKKRCNDNNIEYETSRYQLYNDILNYLLVNDKDNKINYTIVLIIYLIFGLIYVITFTYIIYEFINEIKIHNYKDSKIFNFLCNILILITCGISLIYLPLYIGIKFDKNLKINDEKFDKYMKNLLYILIGLCLLLLLIRINISSIISKSLYSYTIGFIITLLILYTGIIYYAKLIINYYKNNILIINYKYENIKNNEEKKIDILNKYNNDEKMFNDKRDIISEYIIEIFGLKYYKNSIKNDDYNNLNIYIYVIQIILILFVIISILNRIKELNKLFINKDLKGFIDCILYISNNCENIIYNNNEIKILYNLIVKSLIIILVLFIVINSTINYNINLNDNIIIKPLIIYKRELKNINDNFKNLLINDKLDYVNLKSVEKNIANVILLVLYNDIFSDFLSLDSDIVDGLKWEKIIDIGINNEEIKNNKLASELAKNKTNFTKSEWESFNINNLHSENYIKVGGSYYKPVKNNDNIRYIENINITPEFHFTFGESNENKIIDYENLEEYDINYYLNNKLNKTNIFNLNEYSKNVNKQCNTINKYLIYYIIRKIFLYKPIANEIIKNKNKYISDYNSYRYYKNILKYKILKGIKNVRNNKNYLGNRNLDHSNNHIINNIISIRYEDPILNREEIKELLKINKNDNNVLLNKLYSDLKKEKLDLNNSDINELLNFLNNEIYSNIINNNKLANILEDRIDNLNKELKLSSELLEKIDLIINDYINFIIETQTSFYLNYKNCNSDNLNCEYNINNNELINKFKKDLTSKRIDKDEENLLRFIISYKKNINNMFKNINKKLKNFNENKLSNEKYKNNKKNKLEKYIVDNYNLVNSDNKYVNRIILINKKICNLENKSNINNNNKEIYNKLEIIINDIMLLFYFNNYLIDKVYNLYNEYELDILVSNIQNMKKDNIDYISLINKLRQILNYTLNNITDNELTIYDDDNLIDISLNEIIIKDMIKFDKNNNNNKIYLTNVINKIKTFKDDNITIKDVNDINKDNIYEIIGINNKIKILIEFFEENIVDEYFKDSTKKTISDILILQNEVFTKLDNLDINYINLIKKLNYKNKFSEYISKYQKIYKEIYYNDNDIDDKNIKINRTLNTNINNSKITKQDAEKTSIMITILLLIYIFSYISLISIK